MTQLYGPKHTEEENIESKLFEAETYQELGEKIRNHGFQLPTGDRMADVLYDAFCQRPEATDNQHVRESLYNKTFPQIFNRNIWTPEGVYVIPDEQGLGREAEYNIQNLERLVAGKENMNGVQFSNDQIVRYVPNNTYRVDKRWDNYGSGTTVRNWPNELKYNSLMTASFGITGAEKVGEVAKKISWGEDKKATIWGPWVKKGSSPRQYTSALWAGKNFGYKDGQFKRWTERLEVSMDAYEIKNSAATLRALGVRSNKTA